MLGKILKVTGLITVTVVGALLSSDEDNDTEQLDMLDDGMGNVIAHSEHMSRSEPKTLRLWASYTIPSTKFPIFSAKIYSIKKHLCRC